jgi:hypothetical protein
LAVYTPCPKQRGSNRTGDVHHDARLERISETDRQEFGRVKASQSGYGARLYDSQRRELLHDKTLPESSSVDLAGGGGNHTLRRMHRHSHRSCVESWSIERRGFRGARRGRCHERECRIGIFHSSPRRRRLEERASRFQLSGVGKRPRGIKAAAVEDRGLSL